MEEKVVKAFGNVDPQNVIREFYSNKENWVTLFDYYNSKNEIKISPGCMPCFPKVYFFIKKELAVDSDGLNKIIEEITNIPLDTPLYRPDA